MIPQTSLHCDLEAGNWPVWTTEAWPAATPSLPLARQLKLCQGQDMGAQGAWAGIAPVSWYLPYSSRRERGKQVVQGLKEDGATVASQTAVSYLWKLILCLGLPYTPHKG